MVVLSFDEISENEFDYKPGNESEWCAGVAQ